VESARPGDVLADRYLLVDLLTESGSGRFWRAEDRVLERHVALHCMAADDPRAARLTEAARLSATVLDRRILRVLDADERDGIAYVVNEWGSGTSLDIMVASEGPLPPRRAAWIVSEAAASMAAAHEQRVAHGRLAPENVLLDEAGSVRVIGFCVDAALMGLPAGEISSDVADLGGLLYFLLTGKWAGASPSEVPAAPRGDRWLRPRQIRAGIPRVLDTICDQVLNPFHATPGDWGPNLQTARGLCETLREYVGDPTGLAEPAPLNGIHGAGALAVPERRDHGQRGPQPAPRENRDEPTQVVPIEAVEQPTRVVPQLPTVPPPVTPPPAALPDPVHDVTDPAHTGPINQPPAPGDVPTQAGMPIFDEATDDVSWLERRQQPPPPPPEFEDPPERPLFAPEPSDGGPARRPRPGAAVPQTGEYWPWDTGTGPGSGSGVIPVTEESEDDEVPGRSGFRLAVMILMSLVLLVAVVIAYNLGRGKTPLGAEPEADPTSSAQATEAPLTPFEGLTATDLDPQGDPPEENPDLAGQAVDGDPATTWRTSTYNDQLGPPPGLKTGVGLYVDLGESREVAAIDLTVVGAPTDVTYFLTDQQPTGVADLTPLEEVTLDGERLRTRLDEPATGRYLVVWLTSLPAVSDGFRAEIAEVVVSG
jgi:serine/threonine kinase PknH